MYKRLVQQIIAFEKKLRPDQEVGGRFVTAPRDGPIHIQELGYWNPDIIIFHGTDVDGNAVELIQHHSQLSVQLCAVPIQKEQPRRMGFVLEERSKGAKP